MAVPGFQDFMLPFLQLCSDGVEHRLTDITDSLSDRLNLSPEDRRERVPSGVQTKVHNRCSWSGTYLKKAGLLESPARGKYRITELGRSVLRENPPRIDMAFLDRYEAFREFKTLRNGPDDAAPPAPEPVEQETPEEQLEGAYQVLRKALAQDLVERIKRCPPSFLERLVVDLLVAMGYGGSRKDAGAAVGGSGDDGIDGIIKEDRLGLDAVYLQAKRHEATIGRPAIQAFVGSLEGHRANKGVFITTSTFSADAREYVNRIAKKIVLIDGEQLGQLMIDHGIGVTEVAHYAVKKADADYFEEQ
jgi:restriction system protein